MSTPKSVTALANSLALVCVVWSMSSCRPSPEEAARPPGPTASPTNQTTAGVARANARHTHHEDTSVSTTGPVTVVVTTAREVDGARPRTPARVPVGPLSIHVDPNGGPIPLGDPRTANVVAEIGYGGRVFDAVRPTRHPNDMASVKARAEVMGARRVARRTTEYPDDPHTARHGPDKTDPKYRGISLDDL